jgi:hypothetical protein
LNSTTSVTNSFYTTRYLKTYYLISRPLAG